MTGDAVFWGSQETVEEVASRDNDNRSKLDWNPDDHYKEIEVAERYDAVRFDSLAGRVFNYLERRCIRRAFSGIPTDARAVDIPCGTGRLAGELLKLGFQVTGMDISPAMLKVASRRLSEFGSQFQTEVADARELGRDGVRFDVALCARVLMHFPVDEQILFLKGVVEATKGRIVFTQSYSTPYQRIRRWLKRLLGHQPSAAYPISQAELQKILTACHLKEVRRYRTMPLVSEAITVVAERS